MTVHHTGPRLTDDVTDTSLPEYSQQCCLDRSQFRWLSHT